MKVIQSIGIILMKARASQVFARVITIGSYSLIRKMDGFDSTYLQSGQNVVQTLLIFDM
jgi:hypothetical protein